MLCDGGSGWKTQKLLSHILRIGRRGKSSSQVVSPFGAAPWRGKRRGDQAAPSVDVLLMPHSHLMESEQIVHIQFICIKVA